MLPVFLAIFCWVIFELDLLPVQLSRPGKYIHIEKVLSWERRPNKLIFVIGRFFFQWSPLTSHLSQVRFLIPH